MRPRPGDFLTVIQFVIFSILHISSYTQCATDNVDERRIYRLPNKSSKLPTMRAVSREGLEAKLASSSTYYDLMRIFYGGNLSNDTIDNILLQPEPSGNDVTIGVGGHVSYRLSPEDLDQFLKHFQEVEKKSECRIPKAMLINIREISTDPTAIYFPACTIIHQCQKEAGCCNDTSECGVKTSHNISRKFLTFRQQGSDNVLLQFVETIQFLNHSECQCNAIRTLPTCTRCPVPFILRRNGPHCSCECFDRERSCKAVKNGRKSLSTSQLKCVKEEKCHLPTCRHGAFDPITGYCPKKKGKKNSRRRRIKKPKRRRFRHRRLRSLSRWPSET